MLPDIEAETKLICSDLTELDTIANSIKNQAGKSKVWLFEGELGVGKTTLIKSICKSFGVIDMVNSPTFPIINVYLNHLNHIFYHFDFYRVKDREEAIDLGCEEYFFSGDYCFIEWPSIVEDLLPPGVLRIRLERDQKTRLILYLHKNG